MKLCWLWLCSCFAACRGLPFQGEQEPGDGGGPSSPARLNGGASVDGLVGDCGAQPVSLAELQSGRVRPHVLVALPQVVVSSQKFLVSEAKSGSCLWGAFAAGDGARGAGSGVFLVSFGAPHAEGEHCLPGTDGLPDQLSPGDLIEAQGTVEDYVPASCDGVVPAIQLRLEAACPARLVGRGAAPAAAPVDGELAARLAAGKDAELLRGWNGALLQLSQVSALRDEDEGDAVQPFGVIRLAQTPLEVHSRLYYFDLSEGGPRASGKAPRFGYPMSFERITGVLFLDYCSWVLAPRDRCNDLLPASDGCAE